MISIISTQTQFASPATLREGGYNKSRILKKFRWDQLMVSVPIFWTDGMYQWDYVPWDFSVGSSWFIDVNARISEKIL